MKRPQKFIFFACGIVLAGTLATVVFAPEDQEIVAENSTTSPLGKASLTVDVVSLKSEALPIRVTANGNITAWQEASIGTEANNLRLTEVKVNVGDKVRRGDLLAIFSADTIEADLAQSRATVAEADVALAEAAANAERARKLQESGALSAQQIQQYINAESTARARRNAAKAVEKTHQLRVAQARISAPDNGVISARTATVGAVVPAGEELFRLIRGGRLEWRAEVAASDIVRLKPGQKVTVRPAGGGAIEGRLRMLAPMIDIQTRNGLAYVDLPLSDSAFAGMFARGEFEIGLNEVMTLPQSALLVQEGFSYVMRVGANSRVVLTKVTAGRRADKHVEIISGLDRKDRVVVSGAAFLADGDIVRIADTSNTALSASVTPAPPHLMLTSTEGAR